VKERVYCIKEQLKETLPALMILSAMSEQPTFDTLDSVVA